MTLTDEVRSFNRFYTREIGLLNRRLPATDLSLPEARVLYELAHAPAGGRTAAEIGRALGMDKAHLSRIAARFRARGLMQGRVSADHGKHRLLTLTATGRRALAAAEDAARVQVDALLMPIGDGGRERLAEAMRDIRAALDGREAAEGTFACAACGRATSAGSFIARRFSTPRSTAGTGPTRGLRAASSAPSSPNSIPRARTAGSPSVGARLSARSSS